MYVYVYIYNYIDMVHMQETRTSSISMGIYVFSLHLAGKTHTWALSSNLNPLVRNWMCVLSYSCNMEFVLKQMDRQFWVI